MSEPTRIEMCLSATAEVRAILLEHLHALHAFYGEEQGVRIARKHISWYTRGLVGSASFRHRMNQLPDIVQQRSAVNEFFLSLAEHSEHLSYDPTTDNNIEGLAA